MASGTLKSTVESPAAKSLRRFSEGLSDPTVFLTRELRIVYANAEARMHFSKASLILNEPFQGFLASVFPEVSWDTVAEPLKSMLAQEDAEPITLFLKQGLVKTHMRVTMLDFCCGCSSEEPEPEIAVTFFDPDSDGVQRRMEFVLDSSTDGIFIINRSNHIVYFNKACEELTGWKRGAAVMETYECANVLKCHNQEGASMGSEALCPAKVFFQRESIMRGPHEMLINRPGHAEKWVETNYSPIRNPNGDVEFIVGIIRDIDERKRLESQLVQSMHLASLGQLVSGIAHEIKNPLGVLMSGVEVVLNDSRPEEQRREAASFLKDEVRRLDDRVKDFLAFAHPKPLLRDEIQINEVLARVIFCFDALHNTNCTIVEELADDLPTTLADPDMLHQVFVNLVTNADQASPSGEKLIIRTTRHGDELSISIIDRGTGISEEVRPKIFDPFFTTKKKGTGLGLSIVHQIVSAHNGRVGIYNNEDGPGTTFEVSLPIKHAEP